MQALTGLITSALESKGTREVAPPLYRNLYGDGGLIEFDHAWAKLEEADATGFRGLVSTSTVRCTRHGDPVTEAGMCFNDQEGYTLHDSPIICFKAGLEMSRGGGGAHSWTR